MGKLKRGVVTELDHSLTTLRERAGLEGGRLLQSSVKGAQHQGGRPNELLLPPGPRRFLFPAGRGSQRRGREQLSWELGARGCLRGACARSGGLSPDAGAVVRATGAERESG